MKIAIWQPYLYPWALDFTSELREVSNSRVTYFCGGLFGNYPWKDLEDDPGSQVHRAGILFPYREIRKEKPDVLFLLGTETKTSILIWIMCKSLGIRVVPIVEDNLKRTHKGLGLRVLNSLKMQVLKRLYSSESLIITDSNEACGYLSTLGLFPGYRPVVPHGVNTDLFKPIPKDLDLARKLGILPDLLRDTFVLFPSDFSEAKGDEYFLYAMEILQDLKSIKFLIPGPGFDPSTPNIFYYPETLYKDMPKLYSLADIVVIPSKLYTDRSSDRSPNTLIEAMACGKFVIASECGGIPTYLGARGALVLPNSPASLANAISIYVSRTELRKKEGVLARREAVERLNNKVYAKRLWELIS